MPIYAKKLNRLVILDHIGPALDRYHFLTVRLRSAMARGMVLELEQTDWSPTAEAPNCFERSIRLGALIDYVRYVRKAPWPEVEKFIANTEHATYMYITHFVPKSPDRKIMNILRAWAAAGEFMTHFKPRTRSWLLDCTPAQRLKLIQMLVK